MSAKNYGMKNYPDQKWRWLTRFILLLSLLMANLAPLGSILSPPLLAAPLVAPHTQSTNLLTINVMSARTESNHPGGAVSQGDPITQYQYLISVDNTGDPTQARNAGCSPSNAGYPDSCNWPSIRAIPGSAPIFTQGDHNDFGPGITLPNGKYLISVVAEGYKIGGAHFTMPLTGPVEVALQPHPLPSATIRIKVFEDISPVNGQFDAPAEQGLAGFRVVINDILGQVSTDIFGDPICTGVPASGCLYSDANGDVVVPNLGPNRYDVTVIPPDGSDWTETTTLEGGLSWDSWLAEGGTGLDNEFVNAGEPFPWTIFGFIRARDNINNGAITGGVKGRIVAASVYLPQTGGLPWVGSIWTGFTGAKVTGPITDGWVALSDLQNGDTAVYIGRANADGTFQINNVPDGNYFLTWWDTNLYYILDWIQVTVANGQMYDVGTPYLTGWFTPLDGYVFNDLNSNGKRDSGEPGIANYAVVLKDRDNSEIDRMSIAATTDGNGYYILPKAYPMGSWMILEAYNDRFYTTGVTYQVDNQSTPTTVLGQGVDVGVLPILGQHGRLDWGVKPYDAAGTQGGLRNGGIVGTVSYETTRNELDPRYLAVEGWQPGIPGLTVNLYAPVFCGTTSAPCDPTATYELAPDGSYAKGNLLNSAVTETWEQPTGCTARDANGNLLDYPSDQAVFANPGPADYRCLEGPVMGTQFQNGFASLDGNYGFTEGCYVSLSPLVPGEYDPINETCITGTLQVLPADDYLVEVEPGVDALGRPLYQVVREEDINVFGGDQFNPGLQIPPPACVGALHTVDVAGIGADGPTAVVNPSFVDAGGSPYEGLAKPLCDVKLVTLANGKSIAPTFDFFTPVPIPGKWKGYIIDDLSVATDPQNLYFGEKVGAPNLPIGIYDFDNRLITTIHSDPNGTFEVLLPSTYSINCPSPSGVCPNVYYMLGNDPGQPERSNPNYNPQFRTIGASFEIYPGLMLPSDLAPTQIVPGIEAAGSLYGTPPQCALDVATPQIFAVSQPYVLNTGTITVRGQGFGNTPGTVTLGGSTTGLTVSGWSDTQFNLAVAASTPAGAQQLQIIAANGKRTVNGLTFHVIRGAYNPTRYEVGPGRTYATIQAGVDAASSAGGGAPRLVIVYPGTPVQWNPQGAYYENVVLYAPVMLQGVGPGGVYGNGTRVLGSVIDGRGVAADTDYAENWRIFTTGLPWDGNQAIYEGAVVYVVASNNEFTAARSARIDGFTITGGDQQGFPNNVQPGDPTLHEISSVQGGAIFANAYARFMQITNNVVESNGGAYGAIRIGTPHLAGALNDNQNENIRIANNRVIANGGTNLAGAIAIFAGADNYEVASNDVCGNFSAEYGGGISHYGRSPNGSIHHNRVYFNRSYDEGGGIMIAGELPANPATLSTGAGAVNIYANLIQNNLANDDGGGLRLLMAGNFPYNVFNNIIVNNVSTHEGGGVALNDAPNVRFYNNTVMKNLTTATAVTSNGFPAPAGLSTGRNSTLLQATLPGGSPIFSNPLLFNNIFYDNRAGSFSGSNVAGIGLAGDPTPINYWDLGVSDGSGSLSPTNSLGQTSQSASPGTNPQVIATYETTVRVAPWRGLPRFVDILMVTTEATPNLLGDYHLSSTASPAYNAGAASKAVPGYQQPPGTLPAPTVDFDNQSRPASGGFDIGADEFPGAQADLSITKTDGQTNVNAGAAVNYTIIVNNAGPSGVSNALVTDNFPAVLIGVTWTCTASLGSSCPASGSGNINANVTLLVGGSATFVANATLSASAAGSLVNSATVATPAGTTDPNSSNNSASDIDLINLPLPTLGLLDNFDRANAATLNNGSNWSQVVLLGNASIRVNNQQAFAILAGQAIWNTPSAGFGTTQGAAFTFAAAPTGLLVPNALILKATGGSTTSPQNFIRVGYMMQSNQVVIATTTNGNALIPTYTTRGTLAATFANGDTLTAQANADGSVDVWKTTGASIITYLGRVTIPTSGSGAWPQGTGGGRIGMQLPANARVDNFKGGAVSVVIVAAFPQTFVVDTFTQANGPLGVNWAGATAPSNFQIQEQMVGARRDSGAAWWSATLFGPNQEAFMTLHKIGKTNQNETRWQGLLLKLNGGEPDQVNASAISVRYAAIKGIQIRTKAPSQGWVIQASLSGIILGNGDQLGASTQADGTVTVYKNGIAVGSVNVTTGPTPWPAALAAGGGAIGVAYNYSGGRFDNFGGGNSAVVTGVTAAAIDEALGELQDAKESVVYTTELAETDFVSDEQLYDADAAYQLFMPVVAGGALTIDQSQTETVPGVEQPPTSEVMNNLIFLPVMSN